MYINAHVHAYLVYCITSVTDNGILTRDIILIFPLAVMGMTRAREGGIPPASRTLMLMYNHVYMYCQARDYSDYNRNSDYLTGPLEGALWRGELI